MQIIIQHHIFVLALKERKTTDILQIKIKRVPQSGTFMLNSCFIGCSPRMGFMKFITLSGKVMMNIIIFSKHQANGFW